MSHELKNAGDLTIHAKRVRYVENLTNYLKKTEFSGCLNMPKVKKGLEAFIEKGEIFIHPLELGEKSFLIHCEVQS
jgi:hypothetical protein